MRILLCCLLFSFSVFAQFSPARDLALCEKLNHKIEQEQNESIWIADNQKLKITAQRQLHNKTLTADQRKRFVKFYSISCLNDGAFQTLKGQYRASVGSYRKALTLAKSIGYDEGCASCLQNIGTSYDYLGKVDSSSYYFKQALHYANRSGNESTIAYVLTDLGYVHNNLGNNRSAIAYNLKALRIFDKLKDDEGLERTHFAIGRIFDQLKDYDKSLGYYRAALQISERMRNAQRQCLNMNSIAQIYFQQKKYGQSRALLNSCLAICRPNQYESIAAVSYNLLGDIALAEADFGQARENYLKAHTIFKTVSNEFFYAKTYFKLAQVSLRKHQLERAEQYGLDGYRLALANNYPSEVKAISELLAEIYKQKKQYQSALEFQSIAYKISDSIYYDENKNTALKAEYKYHSSLKEAKIKALSQERKIALLESQRQRNIALILTFAIVFLVVTAYFLFNRYKIKRQNQLLKVRLDEAAKTIDAEKKAAESELKALKSQMNPHFIFNALSGIQEQFMYGDKIIANEQMGNFTSLTRQILEVSGKKQILISTEIDILTKYLELEKMRFHTDFDYQINLDERIDDGYHEIPPMLIQPFVENSIKHGLLHKQGLKRLTVDFALDDLETHIICTITDNGIGRKKAGEINAKSKHQSFSTQSVAQRLRLLSPDLAQDKVVVYEDLEDDQGHPLGTVVRLTIFLFA